MLEMCDKEGRSYLFNLFTHTTLADTHTQTHTYTHTHKHTDTLYVLSCEQDITPLPAPGIMIIIIPLTVSHLSSSFALYIIFTKMVRDRHPGL